MTTDFSYNGKQIVSGGPFKPGGKDMPSDARTRVESYADIANIPNPHVGLKVTVKVDETNNNKMTDYIVKSLKADSDGIANTLIDEVVRYVDYLGVNGQSVDTNNFATKEELGLKADKTELHSHINKTVLDGITSANVNNWNNKVDKVEGKILTTNDYTNEEKQTVASLKTTVGDISSGLVKDVEDLKTNGVSQDNINAAIENYLTEHPVQSGATAEQAAQIAANTNAIGDENSGLVKEVNNIKNTELQNLNTAIQTLETLVGVDETVGDKTGLPSGDANVIASINRIDAKPTGSVTDEHIETVVNNYLTEHPITSGATAEQVAQIEANKTAIGDENSGLIKKVNDIKNTELENLNTAIQTLDTLVGVDETVGDKTGLPAGDENVIASINRIDNFSKLRGLVWNCLGDSITFGTGTETQYHEFIKQRTGCITRNYGIESSTIGTQFSNSWACNPMCERYTTMDDNADIISVFGGISDAGGDATTTMGNMNGADGGTFYGAYKILIKGLIDKYPNKIICAFTPLKAANDATHQDSLKLIVKAEKEVCAEYGIPILDLNSMSGLCPSIASNLNAYYNTDKLLPKEAGHERLSKIIQNFLESLI